MSDRREGSGAWAVFVLRVGLGVVLFFAGLMKFGIGGGQGYAETVAGLSGMFQGTWLAGFPSAAFASALPFLEAGLGAMLLAGWRTQLALVLSGLTLAGLTFGLVVLHNKDLKPDMTLLCLLVDAMALALLDKGNPFSLDAWRASRPTP